MTILKESELENECFSIERLRIKLFDYNQYVFLKDMNEKEIPRYWSEVKNIRFKLKVLLMFCLMLLKCLKCSWCLNCFSIKDF